MRRALGRVQDSRGVDFRASPARGLGCAPARVPSRALRVPRHPPESRPQSLVGRDADGRSVLREDRLPGRLRRRTGGPRLRHLGRKTEVREDAPHHGRVLDRGDEVEATAARLAGEDVDRPDAAEQLGPRRVWEAAGASAWHGGARWRGVAIRSPGRRPGHWRRHHSGRHRAACGRGGPRQADGRRRRGRSRRGPRRRRRRRRPAPATASRRADCQICASIADLLREPSEAL